MNWAPAAPRSKCGALDANIYTRWPASTERRLRVKGERLHCLFSYWLLFPTSFSQRFSLCQPRLALRGALNLPQYQRGIPHLSTTFLNSYPLQVFIAMICERPFIYNVVLKQLGADKKLNHWRSSWTRTSCFLNPTTSSPGSKQLGTDAAAVLPLLVWVWSSALWMVFWEALAVVDCRKLHPPNPQNIQTSS